MLILALDTSTPIGSIAIRDANGLMGLLTVSVETTHSEGLMTAVDWLLTRVHRSAEDLTGVACISGPGSFTGLRVGLATAQGLAYARKLACFSFSSLETLAWALPYAIYPYCPLLPARKGWVYARFYRWMDHAPQPLSDELYLRPDELVARIHETTILYGPGLPPYRAQFCEMLREQCIILSDAFNRPRADLLADLAVRAWQKSEYLTPEQLLPYYFGPAQAEINWKQKHSAAAPKL